MLLSEELSDIESILESHRNQLIDEIKEILMSTSQTPAIVSRMKLIEILDCSSSWLSKLTTRGDMPSFVIGGRVFYDLMEICKKKILQSNKRNNKSTPEANEYQL